LANFKIDSGVWPKPVALTRISKLEKASESWLDGEQRSMAVREMLVDLRCVYLWGERMPIVMFVLGRGERWGRKAVPSSPAPRRRILIGEGKRVVDMLKHEVSGQGTCCRLW
jgi:hypothetical protein